jgi:hypothetical protein
MALLDTKTIIFIIYPSLSIFPLIPNTLSLSDLTIFDATFFSFFHFRMERIPKNISFLRSFFLPFPFHRPSLGKSSQAPLPFIPPSNSRLAPNFPSIHKPKPDGEKGMDGRILERNLPFHIGDDWMTKFGK